MANKENTGLWALIMEAYPKYRSFCVWLYKVRKTKRLIPTYEKVILYIFALVVITAFWTSVIIFILTFLLLSMGSTRTKQKTYPSDKYRKVIKEGLLWDTTEYHER